MPKSWKAVVVSLCLGVALVGDAAQAGSARSSTLIVLDRSIGGIVLEETRQAVEQELGSGITLSSRIDPSAEPAPARIVRVWYRDGLIVTYLSFPKRLARVAVLETRSARYRTRSGVGVGSTERKLLSITGVTCFAVGSECQHGYSLNKPGTTFRLDRPGGTIIYVAITFGH
jgi:hypothetical protein